MLRRLVLAGIAAALALPATASAEVTIKLGGDQAKYREVLYPDTFRVKGKTGAYRGPVTLEADDVPFDGSFVSHGPTVNTNEEGEYVFPNVSLWRNAMVRVRAGNELSKAIQLFVHPGVKHKQRLVADFRARVSFTYLGHPGFAPPADAFFVYLSWTKDRKLHRLGGARTMTRVGDGKWRYTGTVKLPRGDYRYGLAYCTRGLSAAGYGRFWPIDVGCGKRTISP